METIFSDIGAVIVISAVLSWLAILIKQPIIIAYILSGVILGPWGLGIVSEIKFIDSVSKIGLTLLLFLAGIVLHPNRLVKLFKQTVITAVISSAVFCIIPAGFALAWGFSIQNSLYIGLFLMFSSTILVIKLLPTTTLHQQHMGSLCIAILIVQDMLAIGLLVLLSNAGKNILHLSGILFLGALCVAVIFLFEQYILRRIIKQIQYYNELLYLISLAWCLGTAILFQKIGLSYEIGAFIAGVAMARNPASLYLSEGLKFFRDFFLVLFFFVLGAKLDLLVLQKILVPSLFLCVILMIVKPLIFYFLFRMTKESKSFSREISLRLNQASEFSLILAVLAHQLNLLDLKISQLIQTTAIFSIIFSSYITVIFLPTPLGTQKTLKQD